MTTRMIYGIEKKITNFWNRKTTSLYWKKIQSNNLLCWASLRKNSKRFFISLHQKYKHWASCYLLFLLHRFSHPHIRSRLEKLMGSNRVSLTDRKYMLRLQERILEEYAESMDKRIKVREVRKKTTITWMSN